MIFSSIPCRRISDIIPDSEDEGDDEEDEGGEMLSCTQQEAILIYAGHKGFGASSEREHSRADVRLQSSDWDEVVYKVGSRSIANCCQNSMPLLCA